MILQAPCQPFIGGAVGDGSARVEQVCRNVAHWLRQCKLASTLRAVYGFASAAAHGRKAARQPVERDTQIGSPHTLILPSMQVTVSPPTQTSVPARST